MIIIVMRSSIARRCVFILETRYPLGIMSGDNICCCCTFFVQTRREYWVCIGTKQTNCAGKLVKDAVRVNWSRDH